MREKGRLTFDCRVWMIGHHRALNRTFRRRLQMLHYVSYTHPTLETPWYVHQLTVWERVIENFKKYSHNASAAPSKRFQCIRWTLPRIIEAYIFKTKCRMSRETLACSSFYRRLAPAVTEHCTPSSCRFSEFKARREHFYAVTNLLLLRFLAMTTHNRLTAG